MIRVEARPLWHGLTSGLGLPLAIVGAVVLVPSLALLYTLVLRGRLDTGAVFALAVGPPEES